MPAICTPQSHTKCDAQLTESNFQTRSRDKEEKQVDLSPVLISLKTSVISIIFTFFLGIWAARAVIALKSERAKAILDGVLTLPLVLPPTVAGFFLLYIFGVKRPIGKLLLAVFSYKIVFTWQATVLAAAVISFPLMYRSARGAFELVDENVLNAARTLGIPERKVFWKILMPMAMPGVLSGGVLAFARGLGEFGATAMIAGNIAGKTRTLPLAIYSEVAAGDMEGAGKYVIIIVAISLLIVAGMNVAAAGKKKFS
ncbi:molybdate ABC transporter permease subunit [Hungatella hathewayi]|uniref:molybdate ABC transporter permease subunit n=1 Tax=Hungatella hathewayi TaxID=154046 RepID=UPI003D9C6E20